LPNIPRDQRTRVAHFLDKKCLKKQAVAVTTDVEHKFDLALHLGELKTAYDIALTADSENTEGQRLLI
jgi:coatomer subunit beta'